MVGEWSDEQFACVSQVSHTHTHVNIHVTYFVLVLACCRGIQECMIGEWSDEHKDSDEANCPCDQDLLWFRKAKGEVILVKSYLCPTYIYVYI